MSQTSAQTSPPAFNGVSTSPAAAATPVDELAFGLLINRALGGPTAAAQATRVPMRSKWTWCWGRPRTWPR